MRLNNKQRIHSQFSTTGIFLSRLRPGSFLLTFNGATAVILNNHPCKSIAEVRHDDGSVVYEDYNDLINCEFMGRGERRRFLPYLVALFPPLARKVNPYRKP